jgi:hypothetical protein
MLQRFAAATAIASVAIAFGALVAVVLMPALTLQKIGLLTSIWCFVPLAWGLWALLAPAAWVPQRFPLWGAILGVMAGFMAAFVLNMPSRILGESVPAPLRGAGVLVMAAFYYSLWMLVRVAWRSLTATTKV